LPVTEVVHSHFVSFGTADEIEFLAACRAELAQRGLGGEPVTGRARRMAAAGPVHGFALMLHGLKRAESVAIQETGLGRIRFSAAAFSYRINPSPPSANRHRNLGRTTT
jgi:hypothetical protein